MNKAIIIVIASAIAGCASVAVNADALQSRTASALGLRTGEFTISNRNDSGIRTDYTVTTSKNQVFSCFVTGSMSLAGRVVSDAICSSASQPGQATKKTAPATKSGSSCNALLQAANKC